MKNMKDSPSIPQRVLVEQESGSDVLISTPAWLALAKKAGKNDVPLSVLEQVYARGLIEAEPHPKNTPEQQAFHRVESFIHEGKAFELDNDLTEMCPVPDGSKHMDVIKNAIKNHKTRIKSQQQVNEAFGVTRVPLALHLAGKAIGAIHRKVKYGEFSKSSVPYQAAQLAKRKEIVYQANKKFQEKHPEPAEPAEKEGPKRSLANKAAREVFGRAYTAQKAVDIASRLARKKGFEAEKKRQSPQATPNQDVTSSGQKFSYSNKGEASKGWNAQRSRAEKVGFNSRRQKLKKAGGGGKGIG